jgi:hypothetical protein
MVTDFKDLEGKRVGFCGVDNLTFCVQTEEGQRLAFEVVEDESDGYRSMLETVKPVPLDSLTFFQEPVTRLTVADCAELAGWKLVDESGHAWLKFGTDDYDDYYPCFTFTYDPPKVATPSEGDGGPK